jgi:Flp pilus assembly pilin Flp
MQPLTIHARRFLADEDGPTVCEYAIMLSLIVVAAIAGIRLLGEHMRAIFALITGSLS